MTNQPVKNAVRIPGVEHLAQRLWQQNPQWSWLKCVAQAKAQIEHPKTGE